MSKHLLIIGLDKPTQKLLDEGYLVYPEHLDDRSFSIHCVKPDECHGWQECLRQHICKHGHHIVHDALSIDGPCPGVEDDNCIPYYDEEAEFHGQWHTYRWGWGWTVEWPGCVVADSDIDYYSLPVDRLPRGEYAVQDDWDDDYCSLELIYPTPEAAA